MIRMLNGNGNGTSKKHRELQLLLDQGHELPRHVAIIMDGNGRWARRRGLPRAAGHREGVKSVRAVVEAAGELGIEYLTLYTFSKENWKRPVTEVSTLMKLLVSALRKEIDELMKNNVRLRAIGDINDLPEFARDELVQAIERTSHNTGLNLNLALSYGGRSEILAAVRELAYRVRNGELHPEDIDEEIFSGALYTRGIPDPDLLIRTSGEERISNFLLWQLAYTELYITRTLWPDFRKREFYTAIVDYLRRERRFGMISEQVQQMTEAEV
ncbi:MAG: isoprenyl transferase [Calditrichaeota bacterium]|nr:MAG: isoprenyl transferase [Calditrichota bacterium]